MNYTVEQPKSPQWTERKKICYASKYTLKWMLPPFVAAVVLIILVKSGFVTKDTKGNCVDAIYWLAKFLADTTFTIIELVAFSYLLLVGYLSREKNIYKTGLVGVAKCIFFVNMFPLAYMFCMWANIPFVPANGLVYLSMVGYCLGGLLFYLLPADAPPQQKISKNN